MVTIIVFLTYLLFQHKIQVDWNSCNWIGSILNKPIVPALPIVTTASAAGGGALAYNSGNGTFTYTPPDLSGYLTSYTETDPVFAASDALLLLLLRFLIGIQRLDGAIMHLLDI